MKKNPFYGISAAAMLFGCYLLNHALGLEPGHLGRLLLLVGVLQVYEGLLLALGVVLVSSGRAPRDGVAVLAIGTLFVMDATLLATECVTAAPGAGAAVAVLLMALAVGKLALVRRYLPGTLQTPVAVLLGAQAVLVLALPIAVVQLAEARLLGPLSMYGLWWLTLALPLARRRVLELTQEPGAPVTQVHAVWTWVPAGSVVLHLWALGWIHQVSFLPAMLAPFLLGLALASEREQVAQQALLPALALLFSLGQIEALAVPLLESSGPVVSPLRLAAVGVAATWAILGWRYGRRWLFTLGVGLGLVGLLAGAATAIAGSVGAALRLVGRILPRTALGWGVMGVVGGFVFLALGAWRSFRGESPKPPATPPSGPAPVGDADGATA